ncbi:hypothetical protein LINPERHAP2_LOCUS24081 [Linum perenne]
MMTRCTEEDGGRGLATRTKPGGMWLTHESTPRLLLSLLTSMPHGSLNLNRRSSIAPLLPIKCTVNHQIMLATSTLLLCYYVYYYDQFMDPHET